MRTLVKSLLARACDATGGLRRQHANRLVVLTFHRVCPDDAPPPPPMQNLAVNAGDFRRLLLWLRERHEPFALDDWLAGKPLPERGAFAVTFDDGWADNYHHAWPILRELKIPATIFLSTSAIENRSPFWWQVPGPSDAEIERLKHSPEAQAAHLATCSPAEKAKLAENFLTWAHVTEMARDGLLTFGAHGHRHALLDGLSRANALADIRTSWELLRSNAPNGTVPLLAWPNGNTRTDLNDEWAGLGLRAAFGTARGTCSAAAQATAIWNLPRNNVDRHTAAEPGLWPWLLLRAK